MANNDDLDIDPERGRASVDAARVSQARDDVLIEHADDVFGRMRSVRIENHWAEKIGRALRGAA